MELQIPLLPYERQALESLERKFQLERELVIGFALSLCKLYELFQHLVFQGEASYRQGRIALIGFINHTHHLLIGGMGALDQGNVHVWSGCVRGLIETFGACVMVSERPVTAPTFLRRGIKAGKLRAAAERGRSGLAADIVHLNNIVHPASGAIFAGFHVIEEEERQTLLQYGLRQPKIDEGLEGVVVLANLAKEICTKLESLASSPKVLNAGKPVMERSD